MRDSIRCAADLASVPSGEGGDQVKVAKNVYRSGFFFIEGCFYNDMRYGTLPCILSHDVHILEHLGGPSARTTAA